MYKLERNGGITRYYDENKWSKLINEKGEAWKTYRALWNKGASLPWHGRLLEVLVELTSWCNYTCKMCFRNFQRQTVHEFMSLDMVEKIAEEIGREEIYALGIGSNSECLLHPQIENVLEILLSTKTLDVYLTTNGSLLNEKIIGLLIDNEVRQLNVSLDAVEQDTYRKIRGGSLTIVEKNINRFLDMRGSALFPLLRVSMVELEDNIDEREAFLQKWEGLADIIDYQALVDFSHMDDFDDISHWRTDCQDPFRRLEIDYKGDVFPCCVEYGRNYPLGNIRNTTLKEVWTGEKISTLRSCFQRGDIPLPCRKCLAY